MPDSPIQYEFHFSLDPEGFRKQRLFLAELLDSPAFRKLGESQIALVEGLIGLTDAIADQAHDKYGLPVLLSSDGTEETLEKEVEDGQ